MAQMTGAAFQNRAVSPKSPRTTGARISSALKELRSNSPSGSVARAAAVYAVLNEPGVASATPLAVWQSQTASVPCTESDGRPRRPDARAMASPPPDRAESATPVEAGPVTLFVRHRPWLGNRYF
jgi:hypothetical protein